MNKQELVATMSRGRVYIGIITPMENRLQLVINRVGGGRNLHNTICNDINDVIHVFKYILQCFDHMYNIGTIETLSLDKKFLLEYCFN